MAHLYYDTDLAPADLAAGETVEIVGDEARHAVRVSRLRAGERILVGDGAGTIAEGEVVRAERDRFAVRVDAVREAPPHAAGPRLVLVQALAKGDRDERAVEQATEFGVDAIHPWEAARSVSRWSGRGGSGSGGAGSEKTAKGLEKWRRIAREASKQSLRPRIPEVGAPLALADLAARAAEPGVEVVALHPRGGGRLTAWAATPAARSAREILLAVGPEGGFADDELDALEAAGGRVLLLGATVLRTSSAGPAALAVLNAALGRW